MADYKTVVERVAEIAGGWAGVPVCHAPSPSAGEKLIYRCTPGHFDGEFETFTVTMRFISRELSQAFLRAERVSAALCRGGDRGIMLDTTRVYITREEGGGSGFIGRTGHFYVISRFEIKYRRSATETVVDVRPV